MKKTTGKLESYGNLCTQIYDLNKPAAPKDALRYYLAQCRKANGPVLELMCGSGRFLIPLRQHGIDIDGLDASREMLAACRNKARSLGLKVKLYYQRLEEMSLPRKYALATIPAASFALVTDKKAATRCLERIRDHLLPGGKLVLEILTPAAATRNPGVWQGFWEKRPDGATITFSAMPRYDARDSAEYQIHKYELFENGLLTRTELEHFALRYYTPDEFTQMLQQAGFEGIIMTVPSGNRSPSMKARVLLVEAIPLVIPHPSTSIR